MRPHVTIGEFSRASHLSVKTLRHYHEVGLLEPSEVDPANGYRYYAEDQIPVAQVIRRLRGLEMPVADVKSVLAAPDPEARNRLIAAHLDRLEGELARTRAAVLELRGLLERPATPRAVEHRTVPPTPAIAIQATVDREDLLAWWQGALGELHAVLGAHDLQPAGPAAGIYASEIFQHGRGDATVFIPTGGAARAVGRVEPLVVPPAELAIMLHRGSLRNVDLTYGELGAHVIEHEISVSGQLREHYLIGFLDTDDPGQWETEIGCRYSAPLPELTAWRTRRVQDPRSHARVRLNTRLQTGVAAAPANGPETAWWVLVSTAQPGGVVAVLIANGKRRQHVGLAKGKGFAAADIPVGVALLSVPGQVTVHRGPLLRHASSGACLPRAALGGAHPPRTARSGAHALTALARC